VAPPQAVGGHTPRRQRALARSFKPWQSVLQPFCLR
jgi:hypothetical protein